MVLAKEWNALNSGLLKQLFDRHYVLAERKAGERACGWCHRLLATRCRELRIIENTFILDFSLDQGRSLTKILKTFLKIQDSDFDSIYLSFIT